MMRLILPNIINEELCKQKSQGNKRLANRCMDSAKKALETCDFNRSGSSILHYFQTMVRNEILHYNATIRFQNKLAKIVTDKRIKTLNKVLDGTEV